MRLNLGCGFNKLDDYVNVDGFAVCEPDEVVDLDLFPYPWDDNSVDEIQIWHTLEHLKDWWCAFCECARILKPGGVLHIRVPDASSDSAMTYRDHLHVFGYNSFHGVCGSTHGSSAWAKDEEETVPMRMVAYHQVPFKEYEWMARWCPRVLAFCARHFRNFVWEQRFEFRKVGNS